MANFLSQIDDIVRNNTSGGWGSLFFGNNQELAPLNQNDYSRNVDLYATSGGSLFEPSGMSDSQLNDLNAQGMLAKLEQGKDQMPWELALLKMMTQQQPQQQQEQSYQTQLKRGQAIQPSLLTTLLNPQNAVKAYRPTLL